MLCDRIAQQNHVDVMVKRLFLRKPSALRFHSREMPIILSRSLDALERLLPRFLPCLGHAFL
jgi:hypothetical protein